MNDVTRTSKELANCPFCGFVAREFHWRGHVGCSNVNCGAHAANITVEQWNRRAPTPEPPVGHDPLGCFEAAMAEGWADALASGDIDRIRDLWERRISYAHEALRTSQPPVSEHPNSVHTVGVVQPPVPELKRISDARLDWSMACECTCSACATFDQAIRSALTKRAECPHGKPSEDECIACNYTSTSAPGERGE